MLDRLKPDLIVTSPLVRARQSAEIIADGLGGLRTVRALAIALGPGRVQVSCNLTDPAAVPLYRVLEFVRRRAARRGIAVESSETIGLVPRSSLEAVAAYRLGIDVEPLRFARSS